MNFVESIDLLGLELRQIPCITGNTPPVESIGDVGCFYLDTSTKKLYKCTQKENNKCVWVDLLDGLINKEEIEKIVDDKLKELGEIKQDYESLSSALDEIIALQDYYTGATFDELHEYATTVKESE